MGEMRDTDNYLTLYLEQAASSPLRYRHVCIIVRDGKVIGQRYNDYRTGFNRGALKTGRLPARCPAGATIAELKKSTKMPESTTTKTFTPFENMGGGKHANMPLSIPSSTLACSARDHDTTHLKRTSSSDAVARLRFKVGILKPLHLNRTNLNLNLGFQTNKTKDDMASLKENSAEKHRLKDQKYSHHEKEYQYTSGQQKQQRRQYAHKLSTQETILALCHSLPNSDSSTNLSTLEIFYSSGHTGHASRSVTERKKHPRVNEADLYPVTTSPKIEVNSRPTALESRPCYRCISYMNFVRIRHLMDALDNLGLGCTSDHTSGINSVFATKHEVLMLRHQMAGGS
ncbi:hypothetical protein K469DRAFT_731406 [Zopfia rhizophila CBS 207.26]|uniref:CMP/dCMP-type deaminase domain-containing protein n=1 Tax=Zopfia rhizophila CBS 207.26 TaxID=1314779 RepID=A0A6A6DME2_9PEZI|nr:hypothetical protein K469DRAFT_731406 [Zopfia rhizophila CBS 207.26]